LTSLSPGIILFSGHMRHYRILAVDDEEHILNFLSVKLKASGYEVFTASNGMQALDIVRANNIDLIVLDLLMPVMDGLDTLKEIRAFSTAAVIILTAKGKDEEKIRGLRLGADDYLAKPFNPDELIARVEAVRRRLESMDRGKKQPDIFKRDDLTIDFKQHTVFKGEKELYFTRIEWNLLSELVQNTGRFMTYEELLSRVWGPEYRGDIQLLRTWVSRLRSKLGNDLHSPGLIRTIPKSGYVIDNPSAASNP
jgi:DNA-binding response OmpR family regulator